MKVPDQDQLDYLASLKALLSRSDPVAGLPGEPADRRFDKRLWRSLAGTGALGFFACPPEEQDPFTAVLVAECLGSFAAPLPFLSSAALASAFTAALPRTDATAELSTRLADGTRIATVGLLGPDGDVTAKSRDLRAARTADGWTISGSLPFVLDADIADEVLVVADDGRGQAAFSLVLDSPGIERRELVSLDRTQPLSALRLDRARAVALCPPGPEVTGAVSAARRAGTAALCGDLVGAAQRLLDLSVEHAKVRVQFGRAIGSRQAIKHKLADMLIRVESARSAVYHLAGEADSTERAAALAKIVCSEAAVSCAGDALQIHGGIGFTWEHRLHWYFKRCTAGAGLLGTPARHRETLLGLLAS